ncbi:MAG: YfcE family phosphodiesterase [Tissierellia bacterium]|nr:YfcE family phosphodiesterase [Tissierellia bacterium]
MLVHVLSDTHGEIKSYIKKISSSARPELILHLGDYVEDAGQIREGTQIITYDIRGNNDFMRTDVPMERLIEIEQKKFLLVHGHLENVHFGLDKLYFKALSMEAEYVLFGHTHIQLDVEYNGIRFLNPGSISRPRNRNGKKTFISMRIKDKLEVEFIEL